MQSPSLPQIALTILFIDFLRYALAAGAVWLAARVVLRRRLAGRRILDAQPAPGQLRREFTYSLSTVLIFAANGLLIRLLVQNGTLQVHADVARCDWARWWASLVPIVVAHDAWFYWTHRALHHRRWFRAVHGRHHASLHPTPWAAYAFHPGEALVQAAFLPLFLLLVPVRGAVIALFLLHRILRNTIGHCARELFPWRWTRHGWLGWVNAGQPPPFPSRAQPRQRRPVLHLVGPRLRHRGCAVPAPWRRTLRRGGPARGFGMKALLLLALAATGAAADPGRDLLGEWWTPGFQARVRRRSSCRCA